jgi:hypothetical protein
MSILKGETSHIPAAQAASVTQPMVRVRLRFRSILEPGCRTVDAGHEMEIPQAHYDPTYHELLGPAAPATADEVKLLDV